MSASTGDDRDPDIRARFAVLPEQLAGALLTAEFGGERCDVITRRTAVESLVPAVLPTLGDKLRLLADVVEYDADTLADAADLIRELANVLHTIPAAGGAR